MTHGSFDGDVVRTVTVETRATDGRNEVKHAVVAMFMVKVA